MDIRTKGAAGEAGVATTLRERLERVFAWYRGLVQPSTARIAYLYDPIRDVVVADGEPIRDIATAGDVARLGRFLGRRQLDRTVTRTIEHWASRMEARDGALVVDTMPMGEPPGIAHSAFLILAMLEAGGREEDVRRLAEGILRQQRDDGSLKVWFAPFPDDGLEFYPGEALLALLRVHEALGDARCLEAAERCFVYFEERLGVDAVDPLLLVFYANWQSQYGALLHRHARDDGLRGRVRDHLFGLHDRILEMGFYDDVAARPRRQATVQVACGLEGIVEAQALAAGAGDGARAERYAAAVRASLEFLRRAQRLRDGTPRERGGFGHSLDDRTQRVDVTGHAAHGLMRAIEVGLEK